MMDKVGFIHVSGMDERLDLIIDNISHSSIKLTYIFKDDSPKTMGHKYNRSVLRLKWL